MRLICKTCNSKLNLDINNILSVMNILNHLLSHGITIPDIIQSSYGCYYKIQTVNKKAGLFASPESLELTCKSCGDISLMDKQASGFALSPVVMHLMSHDNIDNIISTIIKPYYLHG